LLIELNEIPQWRNLWGSAKRDNRMRDLELILRFLALSDDYVLESADAPYNISLKKYLNEYMGTHNEVAAIPALRLKFERTLNFVHEKFGGTAFHNVSPSDPTRLLPNLSSTVFDAVMISSWKILESLAPLKKAEDYKSGKMSLLQNDDYQKILSQETMRSANIRRRVDEMFNALAGPAA
jgi:hypothetical protein